MQEHYEDGSDLRFGPFEDNDFFGIEKSSVYRTISSHGVKSVEFIFTRQNMEENIRKLVFVEAKKSLREDDCAAVSQKFTDSLQLTCALFTGKQRKMLPENIIQFFQGGGQIVFILVIKDCQKANIGQLKRMCEAIKKHLLKEYRIWRFEVKVINEKMAQRQNLVCSELNV